MKLERLENLKKISTKSLIVKEVLKNLARQEYYNKYELEVNLSLILFSLFGDKEIHEEMQKEDIDWINFVDDNYHLIEELKQGEYKEEMAEIEEEIHNGAKQKQKYNRSFATLIEGLENFFSEDNLKKIQENLSEVEK